MGSIDFMPTCFLVEVEGATPDDLETRLENLKDEAFKRKALSCFEKHQEVTASWTKLLVSRRITPWG